MCVSDHKELKRRRAPLNKFVCLFALLTLIDGIVLSQGGFGLLHHCFSSFFPLSVSKGKSEREYYGGGRGV